MPTYGGLLGLGVAIAANLPGKHIGKPKRNRSKNKAAKKARKRNR